MYDQQQPGYYQYGQPVNPAFNPAYNPNIQPNPYNNPYPAPPIAPVYVLITSIKEVSPANIYVVNNPNELGCPFCGTQTQTVLMKKPGAVTYLWCCCLLWFTGILCCIPFCVDSCLDAQLICVRCNNAKQVVPANCCWLSLRNIGFCFIYIRSQLLESIRWVTLHFI